jgi:hypothetical protein
MTDSHLGRFFESVRRVTTFLLASFLWLHALFFFNVQSTLVSKYSRLLRLAPSEAVLCALLVIFSLLAASGFWKSLLSLAYIYAFPFVLMGRVLRWCFLILRTMNRWFKAQATLPRLGSSSVIDSGTATAPVLPVSSSSPPEPPKKKTAVEMLRFLSRPFRRFTLLWGALLIVTTHNVVTWACLVVVLVQLAQQIFVMLKLLFFSPWLGDTMKKIGPALLKPINDHLGSLGAVTRDAAPNDDLKKLWNQLNLWKRILDFLGNRYLLSRWAWVLATIVLIGTYSYIALLFSFAYYGLARVTGTTYSWPDALVNSLFIPFFFSDLPKILAVKILSGVHVALVLGVGIGTIVNFLGRKLETIRKAASDVSDRFADQSVHEKLVILEETFSPATTTLQMESTPGKQREDNMSLRDSG